MLPQITKSYKIIIGVLACLFLLLIGRLANHNTNHEIKLLQQQRDSIINADILDKRRMADYYEHQADSLVALSKTYQKADSLNKFQINKNRSKVRNYTTTQRNAAYDSIFGKTY